MARRFPWFLFQPAAQGALPTLFAATSTQAQGGCYYGHPTVAKVPPQALDARNAARLWIDSQRLTQLIYEV